MSGGSYNYLCHASDFEDLWAKRAELEHMADRLIGLGHTDAARETIALLLQLRQADVWASTMAGRLRDVWKAVEWVDSADWGKDHIDKALAEYRGDPPSAEGSP